MCDFPELPESMCLDFDCGAQIKLGFAAEFSNVLVIYTHIIKKPEDMSLCQAHVTDFSQVSMLAQAVLICTRTCVMHAVHALLLPAGP